MQNLIVVAAGEPAGIGPDVIVHLASEPLPPFVVVGDPLVLEARAKQLGLSLTCSLWKEGDAIPLAKPHTLNVFSIPTKAPVVAGTLNPENASTVIETLEAASKLSLKYGYPLVTAPLHKAHLNHAGFAFSGHTEWLRDAASCQHTVMLFVLDTLKVALATTHLPLKDVPSAITKDRLEQTLAVLIRDLKTRFAISSPRIAVCGLNPHAGENGYLGREEIDVINPIIDAWTAKGIALRGPLPADTAFTKAALSECDAVLAMYHDQALPLIKHLGFERAVNVTLGLPYVRTSVDHGTALPLAGTHAVDPGSMREAILLAARLQSN